jgi:hypothetical protein
MKNFYAGTGMADLRDVVLKAFAGSSKDKPLTIDALRNATAKHCKDVDDLDDMLDDLLNVHTINQVSGYSNGKPFSHYWLTGAKPIGATGKLAEHHPWRAPLETTAKVQPNTSIGCPSKSFTDQPHKEKIMAGNTPSKLNQVIFDKITEQPGIDSEVLIAHAIKNLYRARLFDTLHRQIAANLSGPNASINPGLWLLLAEERWERLWESFAHHLPPETMERIAAIEGIDAAAIKLEIVGEAKQATDAAAEKAKMKKPKAKAVAK